MKGPPEVIRETVYERLVFERKKERRKKMKELRYKGKGIERSQGRL